MGRSAIRTSSSASAGTETPAQDNPLFVTSLERGLAVLDAVGSERRDIGLTDIAAKTGLDKSAAQR